MNLGPSPRHVGSVLIILKLHNAMVSTQLHINHCGFFETLLPTDGNPPTYFSWKDLSGLINHQQPFRGPDNSEPQKSERPKAVITLEVQKPPTHEREE